jgi:hypothetical protein
MRDIENLQRDYPAAMQFDGELFLLGWEAGARYAQGKSCIGGTVETSCNPPDCQRIPDSAEKTLPLG